MTKVAIKMKKVERKMKKLVMNMKKLVIVLAKITKCLFIEKNGLTPLSKKKIIYAARLKLLSYEK